MNGVFIGAAAATVVTDVGGGTGGGGTPDGRLTGGVTWGLGTPADGEGLSRGRLFTGA